MWPYDFVEFKKNCALSKKLKNLLSILPIVDLRNIYLHTPPQCIYSVDFKKKLFAEQKFENIISAYRQSTIYTIFFGLNTPPQSGLQEKKGQKSVKIGKIFLIQYNKHVSFKFLKF